MVYNSKQVFIAKSSNKLNPIDLGNLSQHLVGVLIGSQQAEDAKNDGFNILTIESNEHSLLMLSKNRIKLALMAQENYTHLQKNNLFPHNGNSPFIVIHPPYKIYPIFNAFSRKIKGTEEIREKFNSSLAEMIIDGSYEAILKRHNIDK